MWSGSGLYAKYWNMVKRQLILSKVWKQISVVIINYYILPHSFADSSRNTLQHRQGWIDGRKKWKKYEMIRDPGIAILVALKCWFFLRFCCEERCFYLGSWPGNGECYGVISRRNLEVTEDIVARRWGSDDRLINQSWNFQPDNLTSGGWRRRQDEI